jgi:acyl-coenzyme A thioesterase PaaI-like protein
LNKLDQAGWAMLNLDLAQQQLMKMPYAGFLGVELRVGPEGLETITVDRADLIGNTNLPALHGGVIGSLLDITGILTLVFLKSLDNAPRLVDMDIDYLRSGQARPTYGRAEIVRGGRRIANVRALLWQDDPERPIAIGRLQFLLPKAKV